MVLMNKLQFHLLKAKIKIYFLFSNIYFLHGLCFAKIVPILRILIMNKGAHSNFALDAILHKHATALETSYRVQYTQG